jgi:5-methylcytosine-specific restriction endonuclease McrA
MGEKNWMYNRIGELHHNWRGGKNKTVWKSPEYQRWRKAVMSRDNYTCQFCGDNKGGNLEADHIKPRFLYPELTFDINNGRTLCKDCHKTTPTWGNKVKRLQRALT